MYFTPSVSHVLRSEFLSLFSNIYLFRQSIQKIKKKILFSIFMFVYTFRFWPKGSGYDKPDPSVLVKVLEEIPANGFIREAILPILLQVHSDYL